MKQPGTASPDPLPMSSAAEAELAEDQFFAALVAGDVARIDELLAEEFLIVDVMSAAVVDRSSFIAALRDGLVAFDDVHLVERLTRRYADTAIIVGRTQMSGSFGGASFAAASRYTHVLLRERDGRWRLASAQGTRIDAPYDNVPQDHA
jgi:ketosteroid isomerase-like protein